MAHLNCMVVLYHPQSLNTPTLNIIMTLRTISCPGRMQQAKCKNTHGRRSDVANAHKTCRNRDHCSRYPPYAANGPKMSLSEYETSKCDYISHSQATRKTSPAREPAAAWRVGGGGGADDDLGVGGAPQAQDEVREHLWAGGTG